MTGSARTPRFILALIASLALTVSCAPSAAGGGEPGGGDPGDDGDGADSGSGSGDNPDHGLATLSGTVWMPNYAPSLVPPGTEPIPVFDAVVYLSTVRPPPIPQQVYCERCIDAPANAQYTAHDGTFELTAIPGTYWLVIQKGQWRLEQEIAVAPGALQLTDEQTVLPSELDPAAGKWIPRVAIVLGTNDQIEDVFAKIGFDAMNGNRFVDVPGSGITVFHHTEANPGGDALIHDLDMLRQFHMVFFPCNVWAEDYLLTGLREQSTLDNLRRYVHEGGKLYVTDWSGEVMDRPFPPQITLGTKSFGRQVDSTGTYDPINFGGTVTYDGDANGDEYDATDGEAIDPDLNQWLGRQTAPAPNDPTPQLIDPNNFFVQGNWNWIDALDDTVQTGTDDKGFPIYDAPKAWVIGSRPGSDGEKRPLTVTFEPTGCGRVMYSTYHTADLSPMGHPGLFPQERVLLFLIAEIGVCSDGPIIN